MILLDLDPADRLHLAAALRDYGRRLRRDGGRLPTQLANLADGLLRPAAATSGRPLPAAPTTPHDRDNSLSGERLLVGSAEAARLLRVHPRTLRRRAASGEVPSVWDGSRRRYRVEELEAYIAALPSGRRDDGTNTGRAGPLP